MKNKSKKESEKVNLVIKNYKYIKRTKKLTDEVIAQEAGITMTQIKRLKETGDINYAFLRKLALSLGVKTSDFQKKDLAVKTKEVDDGQALKDCLKERGEAVSDFADKLKITKQMVYHYFKTKQMSYYTKYLLAKHGYNVFNIPLVHHGVLFRSWVDNRRMKMDELCKKVGFPKQVIYYSYGKESFSYEFAESLKKIGFDVYKLSETSKKRP